jgi:hypothetical protein
MVGSEERRVSHPLRWVLGAVQRTAGHGRLVDQVAAHLRQHLPEDHIVLAPYEPRDRGERVPIVVVGRTTLFVVEPRDDEGDLVCYQDHWYRREGPGIAHVLSDSPSLRARANARRVRSDLATGGFINVPIEALVVLTRGRPDDVGSSCVPVVSGVDGLTRHLLRGAGGDPTPDHTHALATALARNIKLTTV